MSMKIGSVRDVLEWAKSQDPEETYNYYDCNDCALARYARSRGVYYDAEYDLGFEIEDTIADLSTGKTKISTLVVGLQMKLANQGE